MMLGLYRRYLKCLMIVTGSFGALLVASQSASAAADPFPDIPSTRSIPEPHTVKDELKLAGDYFAGRGVAQDLTRAAYWYEKAAGDGDPVAQLQVGYLYEAGIGVPTDPVRAFHWFQLADAGGLVRAKVSLGIAYLWGTGVTKNERLAVQFFTEAAAKGSGLAAACLGEMYQLGIGMQHDQAAAEEWYAKGAKLHDPQSEFILAEMLSPDTNGAPGNMRKAIKLLRESATTGYVPAMHRLGYLLVVHPELAKSSQEAIALLTDSAEAGSWRSSLVLGILARDGKFVPASASAAYYHFRVAVLQGGEEATGFLKKDIANLSTELGSNQISILDSEAAQWYERHHLVLEFLYKKGVDATDFPAYALAQPLSGMHAAMLIPSPED